MARVKTTDPEYERASALSDMLDAARQPEHRGLRLGELIDALSNAKTDARVQFDFGGFEPTGLRSYRGYYSDLAISYDEDGVDVGTLLSELQDAVGKTFEGYKGGDYRMDNSTPIWVANWGRSHGVAVVRVEDQEWRVVLHTAMID